MKSSFGLVFDIDGVLLRGKQAIQGAGETLVKLHQRNIPFALLTNGGGTLESKKKQSVASTLGISEHVLGPIVQSHTPLRGSVLNQYRDKRVLILGCREELSVAREYGFRKVVSPTELAAQHPGVYDFWGRTLTTGPEQDPYRDQPVEAIIVMHDPVDYHLELQVCIDLLRCRYPKGATKAPAIYNTNDDIEFSSSFPFPRLAQGIFIACLQATHKQVPGNNGVALDIQHYGKPHLVTFQYCESVLRESTSSKLDRFYMVGDNPRGDIRGANNAGTHWTSILVRTGIFPSSEDNSKEDPADFVFDNVNLAVERVLEMEGV